MNTYGENIKLTVFGQSHADCIGVTIDGLKAGTVIDEEYIARVMALRAPGGNALATKRKEPDRVEFVCGVVDGKAVGSSICAIIRNSDTHSKDYSNLFMRPRPSHADYPAWIKYGESFDIRGGGQFSGRLTAPICIAGAISLPILEKMGIHIATHVLSVGNIKDTPFSLTDPQEQLLSQLKWQQMPVIDKEACQGMEKLIADTAKALDSIGGVIECKIIGLPVGIGEPMFCGMENAISRIMFGVPAVKGIEFGAGFGGSEMLGSQYNDCYYYDQNGNVKTKTNNAGGICGGMTTGMPIVFRVAIKPTPSIGLTQQTIDLEKKENTTLTVHGRHDPCIAVRASAVIRCAAAFAVHDLICQ